VVCLPTRRASRGAGVVSHLRLTQQCHPIVSTPVQLGARALFFLRSDLLARGRYPLLELPGAPTGRPTTTVYAPLDGVAGRVEWQYSDPDNGLFSGQVAASRDSYVLLRQSWHPRWTATVDGHRVHPVPIAPSFVAVPVRAGRHFVVLQYRPVRGEALLVVGAGGLLLLQLGWFMLRRRRAVAPVGEGAASRRGRARRARWRSLRVVRRPARGRQRSTHRTTIGARATLTPRDVSRG
jgi:hypothetical protein